MVHLSVESGMPTVQKLQVFFMFSFTLCYIAFPVTPIFSYASPVPSTLHLLAWFSKNKLYLGALSVSIPAPASTTATAKLFLIESFSFLHCKIKTFQLRIEEVSSKLAMFSWMPMLSRTLPETFSSESF